MGIGGPWTARAPLPGGAYHRREAAAKLAALRTAHPFLTEAWAKRLLRSYGTEAESILAGAKTVADLGEDFGATLTEAEVRFLVRNEFARTSEDVLWRRTKLGLRIDAAGRQALDAAMVRLVGEAAPATAATGSVTVSGTG